MKSLSHSVSELVRLYVAENHFDERHGNGNWQVYLAVVQTTAPIWLRPAIRATPGKEVTLALAASLSIVASQMPVETHCHLADLFLSARRLSPVHAQPRASVGTHRNKVVRKGAAYETSLALSHTPRSRIDLYLPFIVNAVWHFQPLAHAVPKLSSFLRSTFLFRGTRCCRV